MSTVAAAFISRTAFSGFVHSSFLPSASSSSSIVGKLPAGAAGNASANLYSEIPIGAVEFRRAYFGHHPIIRFANNQADARLIVGVPQ
jgi:hypothetical protein